MVQWPRGRGSKTSFVAPCKRMELRRTADASRARGCVDARGGGFPRRPHTRRRNEVLHYAAALLLVRCWCTLSLADSAAVGTLGPIWRFRECSPYATGGNCAAQDTAVLNVLQRVGQIGGCATNAAALACSRRFARTRCFQRRFATAGVGLASGGVWRAISLLLLLLLLLLRRPPACGAWNLLRMFVKTKHFVAFLRTLECFGKYRQCPV